MRRLTAICKAVLKQNVSRIEDVGDIPFSMIRDVLYAMKADQLLMIEQHSPHLLADTEPIWKQLCVSNFIKVRIAVEDGRPIEAFSNGSVETWRELYERERQRQESKMKSLVDKMRGQYSSLRDERATSKPIDGLRLTGPRSRSRQRRDKSGAASTSKPPKTLLEKARNEAQHIKNIYAVKKRPVAAASGATSSSKSRNRPPPKVFVRTTVQPNKDEQQVSPVKKTSATTPLKRPADASANSPPPTTPTKRQKLGEPPPLDPNGPGSIARQLPKEATKSIFLPKKRPR